MLSQVLLRYQVICTPRNILSSCARMQELGAAKELRICIFCLSELPLAGLCWIIMPAKGTVSRMSRPGSAADCLAVTRPSALTSLERATCCIKAAPSLQRPRPHSSNSWVELSSALSQHAIAAPIDGFISLLSMAERSGAPEAECPLLAAASSQNHWCIVSKLQ